MRVSLNLVFWGHEVRRAARPGAALVLVMALCCLPGLAWGQDLLAQGLAAQKAGKHAKALEFLSQYLQKYPHTAEAWKARAASLAALERTKEALTDLEQGLSYNPKDIGLLFEKGKLLASLEKRPEAIATFSAILALEPANTEALKERGENLAQEGKLDEALNDLSRATSLAPTDAWAYQKLGMVQFCLGQYKEAVAALSTAIRLKPETPFFYFARGQIYRYHLDKFKEAEEDFQKGCQMGHPLCCHELEKLKQSPPKKP